MLVPARHPTIKHLKAMGGELTDTSTIRVLKSALESVGAVFIPGSGGGAGMRNDAADNLRLAKSNPRDHM